MKPHRDRPLPQPTDSWHTVVLACFTYPSATSESAKLHLMAVTADGRRIYFTTHHASTGPHGGYSGSYGSTYGSGSGAYGSSTVAAGGTGAAAGTDAAAEAAAAAAAPGVVPFPRRPETLMAVFARAALPHAGVARGPAADLTRWVVERCCAGCKVRVTGRDKPAKRPPKVPHLLLGQQV